MGQIYAKRAKDKLRTEYERTYFESITEGGVTLKRQRNGISLLSLQDWTLKNSGQIAVECLGADRFHKLNGDQRVADYKDTPLRCGRATGELRAAEGNVGGGWMSLDHDYTGIPFYFDRWEPTLASDAKDLIQIDLCGWVCRANSVDCGLAMALSIRSKCKQCQLKDRCFSCPDCMNKWDDMFSAKVDPTKYDLTTIVYNGKMYVKCTWVRNILRPDKSVKQDMYDPINHDAFVRVWQQVSSERQEQVDTDIPCNASHLSFCIAVAKGCVGVSTGAVPDVRFLRVGTVGHIVFECMTLLVSESTRCLLGELRGIYSRTSAPLHGALTGVNVVRMLLMKKRFDTAGVMEPLRLSEMMVVLDNDKKVWVC